MLLEINLINLYNYAFRHLRFKFEYEAIKSLISKKLEKSFSI